MEGRSGGCKRIQTSYSLYDRDDEALCDTLIHGGMWRYLRKSKLDLPERGSNTTKSASDMLIVFNNVHEPPNLERQSHRVQP